MIIFKSSINFSEPIKILMLIGLFLYAFIPFESHGSSLAFVLHMFSLSSITVFALYLGKFKLRMNKIGKVSVFIILFFTMYTIEISSGIDAIRMLASLMFSFITASIINYNDKFKYFFLTSIKYLLIVSATALIIQILTFMLSGTILHIHEIIFPFSEARVGADQFFTELFRFGGIYIEPGTYSNWMYLFLMIYIVINKDISNLFFPIVIAISIIISYSAWGMLFGSYLLIILSLLKIKNASLKIKIFTVGSLAILLYLLYFYFIDSAAIDFAFSRLDTNPSNSSTGSKLLFFEKFKSQIQNFLLIGEGYSPSFYHGIGSPQDAGFILNLSVIFGVLFTSMILFLFCISLIKCCGWVVLFMVLPVFVSKIYFWDPLFWLLYFLVVYGGYSKNKGRV